MIINHEFHIHPGIIPGMEPFFRSRPVFRSTLARLGQIRTAHGVIETPAFVPVGTQATVKSLTPEELTDIGTRLFFVNTYHAYLRPGLDVIRKFGGLHAFMQWDKPLITDSGGFQVFSLGSKKFVNVALSESAVLDRERFTRMQSRDEDRKVHVYPDDYKPVGELVRVDEDGVTFTSHWDGSQHRFTPEVSIGIQRILGSDLMIAFDECAPYPTTHEYANSAMDRTHRWAVRSLREFQKTDSMTTGSGRPGQKRQYLFGVIQGSTYEDLRKESTRIIASLGFDGIAIGGVSVGESKTEMAMVLDWVCPILPEELPRHLLGVGEIDDIFPIIEHGIDTFDCVQPTRLARMGHVFTRPYSRPLRYTVDINKREFAEDTRPLDPACSCMTCRKYSRAYLHHLFRVRELLGYRLATIHNVQFVHQLVANIREALAEGTYLDLKQKWVY